MQAVVAFVVAVASLSHLLVGCCWHEHPWRQRCGTQTAVNQGVSGHSCCATRRGDNDSSSDHGCQEHGRCWWNYTGKGGQKVLGLYPLASGLVRPCLHLPCVPALLNHRCPELLTASERVVRIGLLLC